MEQIDGAAQGRTISVFLSVRLVAWPDSDCSPVSFVTFSLPVLNAANVVGEAFVIFRKNQ